MKKGALVSGALALGVGGSETAAADTAVLQDVNQGLVFGYEYNPGLQFEVVNRLQQSTVDSVLGRQVGEDGRAIVQDPADYNGFVIRYQPDQDASEYAFIFIREGSLSSGETRTLSTDATFFNSRANLLTVGVGSGDGGGDEETTTTTEEGETTPTTTTTTTETTPGNETDEGNETEDVVVGTTTNGDGS